METYLFSRRTLLKLLGMLAGRQALAAFHIPVSLLTTALPEPMPIHSAAFHATRKDKDWGRLIVGKIGEAAASKFISGLTAPIVDSILEMFGLGGEGMSMEALLDEAVKRFAEIVGVELSEQFRKERLKNAHQTLDDMRRRLQEMRNSITESGPNWWEREDARMHMNFLRADSSSLISLLKDPELELAGWEVFMTAVSLRLLILATFMQQPGREAEYRADIKAQIEEGASHHWKMCRSLQAEVFKMVGPVLQGPLMGCESGVLRFGDCWPVDCDYFFNVHVGSLTGAVGDLTDTPQYRARDPYFDIMPLLALEVQWRGWDNAPHYIRNSWSLSPNDERLAINNAKSRLLYWIWSHYMDAFFRPLDDMVFQWWQQSGIYPIRAVAIRAGNGRFVAADADSRRQLIANQDLAQGWAIYHLIFLGGNKVAIRAGNAQYVTAESRDEERGLPNEGELTAARSWIDAWETFELTLLDGDGDIDEELVQRVAFRAGNGKYVSAEPDPTSALESGLLVAKADRIGPHETFELVSLRKTAEIYVDRSNTVFEDGTVAHPFRTISAGVASLPEEGQTIRIAGGSYPERLVIDRPCTLEGWRTGKVVIGE